MCRIKSFLGALYLLRRDVWKGKVQASVLCSVSVWVVEANFLFQYWGKELRGIAFAGLASIGAPRGTLVAVIQRYPSFRCSITFPLMLLLRGSSVRAGWQILHKRRLTGALPHAAGCPLTPDWKFQSSSHWSLLCDGSRSPFPSRAHMLIPDPPIFKEALIDKGGTFSNVAPLWNSRSTVQCGDFFCVVWPLAAPQSCFSTRRSLFCLSCMCTRTHML